MEIVEVRDAVVPIALLSETYAGPMATGGKLFSLQDARNLIRYAGVRPDRDVLQFDWALGYGLMECRRTLAMLARHGWSTRRIIPTAVIKCH